MSSLLVEVCEIDKISKHPNADKLSIVDIKGWHCIVGLNQYSSGDKVIFIPPDCIMPKNLIEKYNLEYLKSNGRVRTVKLRQFISQGLILNIPDNKSWNIGDNVAKELNITKWEPKVARYQTNLKKSKKNNSYFTKYTNIENIKNFNTLFEKDEQIVITEKIHGTNFRAATIEKDAISLYQKFKKLFGKYEFVIGSHNVQLNFFNKGYYKANVYNKIAKRLNLKNILPKNYIFYGEIYGNNIQDMCYGLDDIEVIFFDVKKDGVYIDWANFTHLCDYLSLPRVHELYIGPFSNKILQQCTIGNSTIKGAENEIKEGCVVKPIIEKSSPLCGRKILKSINPKYLLRKGATEFK